MCEDKTPPAGKRKRKGRKHEDMPPERSYNLKI